MCDQRFCPHQVIGPGPVPPGQTIPPLLTDAQLETLRSVLDAQKSNLIQKATDTNKIVIATVKDIMSGVVQSPLPLDALTSHMGVNLWNIKNLEWEVQPDGQLVRITINFIQV